MTWSLKSRNTTENNTLKTKNATAVAGLKGKVPQEGGILYLLTPNYERILVGSVPNEELIYQEAFNNWELKTKVES